MVLNGFGEFGEIEPTRRRLESDFGVRAIHHGADLAKPAEIADPVQSTTDAFGAVDILVNNAVVRHFAPVDEFPTECWDEALAVNLSAAFHAVRLVLPKMRWRNWGRFINMSSVHGFFATAERVDYITTKTAPIGMTRAVAMDTLGCDITRNALCPGTVHTPAIETRINETWYQTLVDGEGISREDAIKRYLASRQPTCRFVAAESVAGGVIFLCGPAGRDITGAALPVDGGWIASWH